MVYNCLRLSSFGKDKKTKSEGDKPETGKSGKKSHKTSSSKTRTGDSDVDLKLFKKLF